MAMAPKRCIVVGGTGTVGRALVTDLGAAGARVGFTYFKSEATAKELLAHAEVAAPVDLRELDAIGPALDRLTYELGGVDAVVHAAAVTSTRDPPIFDHVDGVDLDGWQALMSVNVTSAFVAVRHLVPSFAGDGGNVVMIGSVDGIKPIPTPVPYAVSKAALRGLVLSLAKALGPRKIRVNMVAPGILERGASAVVPDDLRREYLKHSALGRYGRIDEVVPLLSWLALDNVYMTGQTLLLDGGL